MAPKGMFPDIIGVPTYFIDSAITEDAGNGLVRVWNCVHRGGLVIPECQIIIHSEKLLLAGREVSQAAQDIFNAAMLMDRRGSH